MNKQMTLEEFMGRGIKAQKAVDKIIDRPLSHTKDSETSYEAADKMVKSGKLNKQEQQVLKAIKTFLSEFPFKDFTAKTLTCYMDYYTIQRRLSGLYHKGKIERTGEKRNGCCVWRIL